MPTKLEDFVHTVEPESTILLFGSGSSLPSGSPSVAELVSTLSTKFKVPSDGFTLSELTDLIEQKTRDRRSMILALQDMFKRARPTGGLLNVPLYSWKSIYTTNYDNLIEQAYQKKSVPLGVYKSNFDYQATARSLITKLYKLHGSIEADISIGSQARIVITGNDYNEVYEFRQHLFSTLKADLADSRLVIIGHSLADEDVKTIVTTAISLNAQSQTGGRITLFMYQEDLNRATLYEGKGLEVVFGGIDDFFAQLGKKSPGPLFSYQPSDDFLAQFPNLVPVTIDVAHQIEAKNADVSRMFNGWPGTYADIENKLTFERSITEQATGYLATQDAYCLVLVGASGVGKTTACRQIMSKLRCANRVCWEHQGDHTLDVEVWLDVARALQKADRMGTLFIDDAHSHLYQINDLLDGLIGQNLHTLSLVVASSRNNWKPRVKTPNLFKHGREFFLSTVGNIEIDRLLSLIDHNRAFDQLIEHSFAGFSRVERRRRLVERCESDMFVCMKNIFSSENFDNIILREFADLPIDIQDIYRLVATLEHSGVRVHRQLVIRLLGIPMTTTIAILDRLTDIVTEYTIDARRHIYGWRGRHPVINSIIARHKYNDIDSVIKLFELVIDNILPTYEVEIRSLIELCNIETGVARIPDKRTQNRLLRKMVSIAPGQRVPRHRLIRNLIDIGEFEQAATEIRIFENDFRGDGPVARYKVNLTVARATRTAGILTEDRIAILEEARQQALLAIRRYPHAGTVYGAYCEVGIQLVNYAGKHDAIDDAMAQIRDAESRLGDPNITSMIRRFERKIAGQSVGTLLLQSTEVELESDEVTALDID